MRITLHKLAILTGLFYHPLYLQQTLMLILQQP